jgi:hypothetical protein
MTTHKYRYEIEFRCGTVAVLMSASSPLACPYVPPPPGLKDKFKIPRPTCSFVRERVSHYTSSSPNERGKCLLLLGPHASQRHCDDENRSLLDLQIFIRNRIHRHHRRNRVRQDSQPVHTGSVKQRTTIDHDPRSIPL